MHRRTRDLARLDGARECDTGVAALQQQLGQQVVVTAAAEDVVRHQLELLGQRRRVGGRGVGVPDGVECDSAVERAFAEKLDQRSDIKLFVKLPWWFKVETPVGAYNPDWAIVKEVAPSCSRRGTARRSTSSTGSSA